MARFFFLLIFLSLLVVSPVFAETLSERSKADLEKFVAAAQKEITPPTARTTPSLPRDEERFSAGDGAWMMLAMLRENTVREDPKQIANTLTQLSLTLPSDALRLQAGALAAQIESEQAAAETARLQEIEKALSDAATAVRKATVASDLDATLAKLGELNTLRQQVQQDSPTAGVLTQRVKNALDFVTEWQEYLSLVQAGSPQVGEVLGKLSEHAWPEAIPRSEILALIHGRRSSAPSSDAPATPDVGDIIKQINTPADLSGALDALSKIIRIDNERRPGVIDTSLTETVKVLADLEQTYREYQAGLSTKIDIIVPPPLHVYQPFQRLTASVRAQVLSLVLPRYLGLPEEVKVRSGEGPYPFLDRVAAEAAERGDYLMAAKAREAQQLLRDGSNRGGLDSSQAGQYIIGRNQESAGQYALAVANYEKALASASELIPAKAIGERLAAIKAEHPSEFQEGFNNYLAPPVPAYPANYPGAFPRGSAFSGRRPGYGEAPPPSPTPPSLAIPAAPATPAAPPKTP